jgi:ABC-type transport system involved in cytochrome bd biosynthesis fused ATPase/permease subunit
LDLLDTTSATNDGVAAPTSPPQLDLCNVRVTVDGRDHRTLRAISATIEAGTVVALEGPSGVGKSTLLRALAGLDDVAQGVVLVNGMPFADIAPASWHATFAWLPQDPLLPGATVREVLSMGVAYSDDRLRLALDELGLDVALDQALGEGGEGLSGGQRRRLAVARTLLRPATVLLLDEPTAHLDEVNAARVMQAVRRRRVTTIVATHRPLDVDDVITMSAPERFRV